MHHGNRSTTQEVSIMKTTTRCYISLQASKDLCLVHTDFPHQTPVVASTVTNIGNIPPGPADGTLLQPFIVPFPPLEENIPQLKSWLLRHFSGSMFNNDRSPLPVMVGKLHVIHLVPDAKLYACHTPALVPRHWEVEVKKQLDEDVRKSSQPRHTIDYQNLNAAYRRETHHNPIPFDMVSHIPCHTYKTIADAHWGFHQKELQEDPNGHCFAPDAYTRRFNDTIAGIPRKFKCVDDTLLFDASMEDAFWHTEFFGDVCRKRLDGYKPMEGRLAAVRNFDMPTEPSLIDIRSWHGFVNQLAPFLATAPVMEPFRELLQKPQEKRIYWDENLQEKICQAKEVVCKFTKEGLTFYDKDRPTVVMRDWSKVGSGFVVLQQYCSCPLGEASFCCKSGWRLVLCGNHHLMAAEAG
ncbi:hypothetical protein E2C01_042680 [Portunus trituberculatus]|uniref:Uncharacterized protein n=1 Tax=Portunus trituberculatus TaxID=210409 RepID=A0A5B7FX61_PORTR|nr:hypothetical protein [Portunus trituberculatus]